MYRSRIILIILLVFFSFPIFASNQCADLIEAKKYYKALDICKQMAKQGHPSAQFNLGILYYQGLGVMSDKRIANKWIAKAAMNNFAKAQYNLGIMTANGIGADADLSNAYAWLILAKKNGYEDAALAIEKMGEELSKKEKKQADKVVQDLIEQQKIKQQELEQQKLKQQKAKK
ncbi:MAG: tetratricopeptide repeat protein [Pseudomonadota bacterium]